MATFFMSQFKTVYNKQKGYEQKTKEYKLH